MSWRNSDKVIIMHYKSFSCGKFITNILSYNDNFMPMVFDSLEYFKRQNRPINDIDLKHRAIMHTLPPLDQVKEWTKLELGCDGFYGFFLNDPTKQDISYDEYAEQASSTIRPSTRELLETTNYHTFITAHAASSYYVGKTIFPNARCVRIVNDDEINVKSQELKSMSKHIIYYPSHMIVDVPNSFDFDITKMYNKDAFFKHINELMDWLGIKDKTLDNRVFEYYDRYMEFYK